MIILSFPFNENFLSLYHQYRNDKYFKEFRLDYSNNLENFPKNILDEKSIVTIRDKNEGGIYDIPKKTKAEFFDEIINQTPALIDIEFRNRDFYQKLISKRTIISYHNFGELSQTKIIDFIKQTENWNIFCLKIAVKIDNYDDLDFLFQLQKITSQKLLIVGLGKLGKISRLLFRFFSFGTYVGFRDYQTAPGQILFEEIKRFSLDKITDKFLIGGLVGGQQVYHSLGLKFYNKYFQKNNLKAVYLPFEVTNFDNFMKFIKNNFEDRWYGFSVTMPHKIVAAKNSNLSAINLLTSSKSYNTDMIAMKKSLKEINISEKAKILIIGYGGVAKIAFEVLKNHQNIFVTGRNILGKNIPNNFIKISLDDAKNIDFDCVINCTPIGMAGENFWEYFDIKKPQKIINLPYSDKNTIFEKDYISGQQFWEWQSEKQLDVFINNINHISNN